MRRLGYVACVAVAVVAVNHAAFATAADELHAGVAVVDITPPIPFRMSGYFYERLSTGTKDPLHAKAVVFQQGDVSAAIVFCDLVGVPLEISSKAREKASAATGIPVENIAISATHTHTGPLYFGALHDHFHERAVARSGTDPNDSSEYRAGLVDKIAAAIVEAKASLRPVELKAGYAQEDRLAFNRRFHMQDGSVRFNPGQSNPNIVRAAGPVDPQVGIILLSRPNADNPSAAIVSFAMHLDTLGGTEFSADFPKFAEDRLRESFGPGFTLLFGAGTCGDINHIDVTKKDRRSTDEIGFLLAETVEHTVGAASRAAQGPPRLGGPTSPQPERLSSAAPALAVRSVTVTVPLQTYSEGEIAKAREKMYLIGTRELSFLDSVEATKIIDLKRWPGDSVPLEVQVFRLNRDTAIVTLPSEIFVELGLAIKAASPFKTTLVVELTNDGLAYIPTKKAFAEGSYETVNSRVQPGSGERLVEAAIGLLKELE